MILIFDLDDTLYEEKTYVESGFRAVAKALQQQHGWDAENSFELMMKILHTRGRGHVFNELLASRKVHTRKAVRSCVTTYRHHDPDILLAPDAAIFLRSYARGMYLVTDGNKVVQSKKVSALKISSYFERIFITHRYGLRHAKPSTYCFDLIRRAEGCDWSDLIYVGDNPAKDFVSLNALGSTTVRVLTGEHREVTAKPEYDGAHHIDSLAQLHTLLLGLFPSYFSN